MTSDKMAGVDKEILEEAGIGRCDKCKRKGKTEIKEWEDIDGNPYLMELCSGCIKKLEYEIRVQGGKIK